jgi:hypothetical protein
LATRVEGGYAAASLRSQQFSVAGNSRLPQPLGGSLFQWCFHTKQTSGILVPQHFKSGGGTYQPASSYIYHPRLQFYGPSGKCLAIASPNTFFISDADIPAFCTNLPCTNNHRHNPRPPAPRSPHPRHSCQAHTCLQALLNCAVSTCLLKKVSRGSYYHFVLDSRISPSYRRFDSSHPICPRPRLVFRHEPDPKSWSRLS